MQTGRPITPSSRAGAGAGGVASAAESSSSGAKLVGSVFDNYRGLLDNEQRRHQYATSPAAAIGAAAAALQCRPDRQARLMRVRSPACRHGCRRRCRRSRWKWNTTRIARYDNKCRRASMAGRGQAGPGARRYARSDKYVSVGNI